jgi:hypothetical protein
MTPALSLDPNAAAVMAAHLAPGEELLWAGRPKLGFALRGSDSFFILCLTLLVMGVIWGIIAIWRQVGVASVRFSLLFLLAPVTLIVTRYWFDARLRGRTFYGVTNQRAIIVTYWLQQEIQSVYYKALLDLRSTQRWDHTGTLEFMIDLGRFNLSERGAFGYNRSDLWFPGARNLRFPIPPAFEMIAKPLEVERLILKARDEAKALAAMEPKS